MKITFIRHAESTHNKDRNCNQFNPGITSKAKDICIDRKKQFKDIDLVITSSLERCLETTDLLFRERSILVFATDLVRPLDFDQPCNQREDSFDEVKYEDSINFKFVEEIENIPNVRKYVLDQLLYDLSKLKIFKNIGIVTHNSFINLYRDIPIEFDYLDRYTIDILND